MRSGLNQSTMQQTSPRPSPVWAGAHGFEVKIEFECELKIPLKGRMRPPPHPFSARSDLNRNGF
jgi:hypothetical protein